MRITSFTDYSFRVLIHTAIRHPQRVTIDEVANSFGISRNHLVKVIHGLSQAGFLATQRGRNGGFVLAKPAERIRVGDVVRFGEDGQPLVECFDSITNTCAITPVCKLKFMLSEAQSGFYAVLDRYTIADICAKPEPLLRRLGLSVTA